MLPGYAFSTQLRVRYAEIDGQKIVFNSRYLEYVDVATTEYWEWTGIDAALGEAWRTTEFNVRRAELDYLRPFRLGDRIDAHVRLERLGGTSMTHRFALAHAETGAVHCEITVVSVCVDLEAGRPVPIEGGLRAFLEALMAGQPERVA